MARSSGPPEPDPAIKVGTGDVKYHICHSCESCIALQFYLRQLVHKIGGAEKHRMLLSSTFGVRYMFDIYVAIGFPGQAQTGCPSTKEGIMPGKEI